MTQPVVRDISSKIRSSHRAQSRRRWLRIGIIFLTVLLIGGGVWAVWFSNWFVVRSIEVTGNENVSTEEVVAAAAVEMGAHLVGVDTAATRQRVLELPVVADARVTRQLSGVVLVAVTERSAVYALPASGGYRLVDADGTDYLFTDALPPGLPVVLINKPPVTLVDGQPDEASQRRLSQYARLLSDSAIIVQALPVSVREQMVGMRADTPDSFTIDLANGAQILWGSAEQSTLKAEVIDGLLKVAASYYDISSPSHPATR